MQIIIKSILCKQIKRLQNNGMTSDEDISNTSSPNIRRRLGSCSGGPDQQSTKEDTYSPGLHYCSK